MSRFNGLAIVACSLFTGNDGKLDKNGKSPVILSALAGKIPSKRVLSGTIADNSGFIPGKSYVCTFSEQEPDAEFGRQFNFVNGGVASPEHTLMFFRELGAGAVVEVDQVAATSNKPADEVLNPV